MDYTQSFEEFSKGLTTNSLIVYAGAGIVLWVLFKDKLSPVSAALKKILDSFKSKVTNLPKNPVPSLSDLTLIVPSKPVVNSSDSLNKDDVFFQLVSSWKQTRDLAVKSGCQQAVEVADQMFPFLSPTVCEKSNKENDL
jgi:hypothetical protein